MLTLNDIINVSFRKSNFSGYRTEDVDGFIDMVKDSYDLLIKKSIQQKEANESLVTDIKQLQEKMEVLATKIEEYRGEEDEIKNALVSAQKLGDASVREARHKAEIIIKDANIKAERIVLGAKQDLAAQSQDFEQLKQSVSDFRSKLLTIYKEHLTLIDALPTKTADAVVPENDSPAIASDFETEQQELTEQEQVLLQDEEDMDFPLDFTNEAANDDVTEGTEQFDDPLFSSQATQSFHLDVSNFVTEPQANFSIDHDMRYDVLKFGDNYDITGDTDSPVGIFDRNK